LQDKGKIPSALQTAAINQIRGHVFVFQGLGQILGLRPSRWGQGQILSAPYPHHGLPWGKGIAMTAKMKRKRGKHKRGNA